MDEESFTTSNVAETLINCGLLGSNEFVFSRDKLMIRLILSTLIYEDHLFDLMLR
jgi:hypothetical protein